MKFLLTNREINDRTMAQLPYGMSRKSIGRRTVLLEEPDAGIESDNLYSITDGYVRDLSLESNNENNDSEQVIQSNYSTWPLPEKITGSFSSLIFKKNSGEFFLCNDLIGIYPLYYLKKGEEFYVSNSIILLGIISGAEPDEAGIAQRCIGPEYTNIGSRTILKGCKRLLPGEWINFDSVGNRVKTKYDNSLFQNISSPNQNNDLHIEYWRAFKKDIAYALNKSEKVNIALSGGIDSRIILGAIPAEKNISCFTYGSKDNYETHIARRLAKVKNAAFQSFSKPELYFPDYKIFKKYTLKTEALYLGSWLEILETVNPVGRSPLLLGDLTTALTGRTIEKFSLKKMSVSTFLKHYLVGKDYVFERSNSQVRRKWEKNVLHRFDSWYTESRLSQLDLKANRTTIIEDLHSDLKELFTRIEAHKLPYTELADELFIWYTHTRGAMAKQVLVCNDDFEAYCPSMSLQNLRRASNIHPNLRLGFRFVNKLFRETQEMRVLDSIPTSQAPLVPSNSSSILKYAVWGIRSKIDGFFIRRLVRSKDPAKRYRLFKSNNWVTIYQNPEMENNLKSYFKNNHLGYGFYNSILKQAILRKKLEQWPFANMQIVNASSLNMELDLIKKNQRVINEV